MISYNDGSKEIVTTYDKNWKYFNNGPIIYSSLYLGEIYDATKETKIKGWATSDFDDSDWKNVLIVPLESTSFFGRSRELDGSVSEFNFDDLQ